jgi:hypothetical protein
MRSHLIRTGPISRRSGAIGALLLSVTFAAACSTASTPSGETGEAKHAMHSDRLRKVMKTFDTAVRRNVATEVDTYGRWEGVFPEMTDAAEALEKSAIQLSGHPPKNLELPARARFQVLARSLATAAGELRDAAARNDADAVESARTRLGNACRDCHDRYRPNSPGVPDAFR